MNGINTIGFGAEMGVNTATGSAKSSGVGFESFLQEALNSVEETEAEHTANTMALLSGEINDISQVTIAAEKAYTSVLMVTTIRDKVLDAYKEIMNMQV